MDINVSEAGVVGGDKKDEPRPIAAEVVQATRVTRQPSEADQKELLLEVVDEEEEENEPVVVVVAAAAAQTPPRAQARQLGEGGLSRLASLRGHRRSLTNSIVDKFRRSMVVS